MTVNTGLMLSGPFAANGTNKDWDFGFKVSDDDQILILIADDTNGLNLQPVTTNYTVDPQYIDNNNGGVVVYPAVGAALVNGQQVWISTRLLYEQDTDFTAQGSFSAALHEAAMDYLSLQIKQLARQQQYSVQVQVGSVPPTIIETIAENDVLVGGPGNTLIGGPSLESVELVGGLHDEIIALAAVADDIDALGPIVGDITTVALNVSDVTNFSDVYLGPHFDEPTTRNDGTPLHAGDMYFSTASGNIRVYSGAAWASPFALSYGGIVQGQAIATAGQTVFNPGTFTDISVYKNGLKMASGSYTAATPNITLAVGAIVGDVIAWLGYNATSAVTSYTKAEVNALVADVQSDADDRVSISATGLQTMAGPLQFDWSYFDGDHIPVSKFGILGDGSDERSKMNTLIAFCEALYDAGRRGFTVDLEGRVIGIGYPGIIFQNKWDFSTVKNGSFKAVGAWPNVTVGTMAAYYNTYQTVSGDSKTWALRDPVVTIGGSIPGFSLQNVVVECDFRSAGVLSTGGSKNKRMERCYVYNAVGYHIHAADTLRLSHCQVRGDTNSNGFRNSYGLVYDSIDCHWDGTTAQWCHCPLLITGATLFLIGCDLFNGSGDPSSPITSRLIEYRGNTCCFTGGRLGNGQIHLWGTDINFQPTKHGYTDTSDGDSLFVFHATEANQEINGFLYYPAEMPTALTNGTVKFIDLAGGPGLSWKATNAQVEALFGYNFWLPDTMKIVGNRTPMTRVVEFIGLGTTSRVGFRDKDQSGGYPAEIGSVGNYLVLATNNVDQWELNTAGTFRPVVAGKNIGGGANRIGTLYAQNAVDVSSDERLKHDIETIPYEDLYAARLIRPLIKRYKMNDGDGRWHYGVIAQEVEAALEEAHIDPATISFLNYGGGTDDNPAPDDMMSIRYDELQMLLLAAM